MPPPIPISTFQLFSICPFDPLLPFFASSLLDEVQVYPAHALPCEESPFHELALGAQPSIYPEVAALTGLVPPDSAADAKHHRHLLEKPTRTQQFSLWDEWDEWDE